MNEADEKNLLLQTKKGNVQAFETIVTKYERIIYSLIYTKVHNPEDARDIAQEVFLKAYEKIHQYDATRSFFSWIAKIAINASYQFHRNRKPVYQDTDWELVQVDGVDKLSVEDKMSLMDSLSQLNDKDRQLVLLKYFDDFSIQEISHLLNMGESAVKVGLMRAKEKLGNIFRGEESEK